MAETINRKTDDGFGKVIQRSESIGGNESFDLGVETGDSKSTRGNSESIREAEKFAGFDVIDPFDTTGQPAPAGKHRGRPRGSKNRTTQDNSPKDLGAALGIANFEALLYSIHFMGAKLLETKELEIDEEEAKRLSDAIQNVVRHYNTVFDPKKLAIAQLCFVAAGIYGPRAIAIIKKDSKPKAIGPAAVPTPINQPRQTNQGTTAPVSQPTPTPPLTNPSQLWAESPIESDLP